jgi:hypothetical protein
MRLNGMQKYHLMDAGEVTPEVITYLMYGRIAAPVLGNGMKITYFLWKLIILLIQARR